MGRVKDIYDYIVVGAGSAGCVLANRLSANPKVSVLLIDAGTDGKSPFIPMPRGYGVLLRPGSRNVKFYKAGRGGNRKPEMWFKGATIGGSSAVNGMVYVRGAPMDYDGWEAAGCSGWGWREMSACFAELEDNELGPGDGRGVGGPLPVTIHPRRTPLHEALIEAGVQSGLTRADDVNAPAAVRDGCIGYVQRNISRSARRQTSAEVFLRPVRGRRNLTVVSGNQARRIVFDGTTATGVVVRDGDGERTLGVRREVIVSAGAIESPKLLQLSGVGPADLLAAHGVPLVVDSPGVGRNLREHRYMQFTVRLSHGGDNAGLRWPGLLLSAARYYLFRSGPLSYGAQEVLAVLKTSPEIAHADAQIGVSLYSTQYTRKGQVAERVPGLAIGVYPARPQSQGTLRIASADPDAAPLIDANYFDTEEDRRVGVGLLRWAWRFVGQPALKPFAAQVVFPPPTDDSDEALLAQYIDQGVTTFHVAGTCRMGSDAESVVDTDLRLRGVANVRVCDTSVFPTLVTGNTNGAAMAVALRLAQRMGI